MFSSPAAEYAEQVQRMIDELGRTDGAGFSRSDCETHVREEQRAGFAVEATAVPRPTHGEFVCRRR